MSRDPKPQHDIAQTLRGLLPVQGTPKTLREIRDQVRLLNDIRDPSDERLSRIIVGYFRNPRYNQRTRFLKVAKLLSDDDPSAQWTRVRIGPAVSRPAIGAGGTPPNQRLIAGKLSIISEACARSSKTSFYAWDLLKEHFGITRDNNRYYYQWLDVLSDALKTDPRFVLIAVDEKTNIPVEWMLAVDHERQAEDLVRNRLPEVINFMQRDEDLIHLTRDLVHHFFVPSAVDETFDIHVYYRAVSKALADSPSAIQISVQEETRKAEAWCLNERIQQAVLSQLDSILGWLRTSGTPQSPEAILPRCFASLQELVPTETLASAVSQALAKDLRFLFDPDCGWRAIPPGLRGNLPAYHVLWRHHFPLSEEIITQMVCDRFPTLYPDLRLAEDSRFRLWRGDKWGLSEWIDINDWAYEYLRKKEIALLPSTIAGKVCKEHGLDIDVAVFTPGDDPRFVSHPHGRWYYRHAVTDVELDQMFALLCSLDGGLTLNELVIQTVGLDASDTDAHERLAQHERFVFVTNQWFAREQVMYRLADEDVDQLLAVLQERATGLRLRTLVQRVLGREIYLTDAEEKLRVDSRFQEILPGVWTASDLQPLLKKRTPIFSRPVRSEGIVVIPEDECTIAESATMRESRPRGDTPLARQGQITRTLSLLDVRHGNLIIDRPLAGLMPSDGGQAVHFTDEAGCEFTGWIDRENNLLQGLGNWFEARQLTFGDKIVIRPTDIDGFFEIEPKGQRDERVYQEALQRQDVENLIDNACQTQKSYHDLMIEVMDYFNQTAGKPMPLHREDIYNLVNYTRTASRNYIFSLLSLTDCPYEELRYFVPHGHGYWSFDRERRKAFEIKMNELLERVENLEAENESLRQSVTAAQASEVGRGAEMAKLAQQVQEQEVRIVELSARNTKLSEANQCLSSDSNDQLRRIEELDAQISALKMRSAKQTAELKASSSSRELLQKELADTCRERNQLRDSQKKLGHQAEGLIQSKLALEGHIAACRVRIERLTSQNNALLENADRLQSEVEALSSENATLRQEYEQSISTLRSQALAQQREYENLAESLRTRQRELQNELQSERDRGRQLQERLEVLDRLDKARAEETARLRAKVDQAQVALRTPLGKGFVAMTRLLGGPDLSDLQGGCSNE